MGGSSGTSLVAPDLSNRQLFLDPADLTTLSLYNQATFASASSQKATRDVHSDLDGNGKVKLHFQNTDGAAHSIFGFSVWVRFPAFTNQNTIFGKLTDDNTLNAGVFLLRLAGSGNKARIDFDVWKSDTITSLVQSTLTGGSGIGAFPLVANRDYHICGWYDGSKAGDDTLVLNVYLNGIKLTTGAGSTLPAQLWDTAATRASTSKLILGSQLAVYSDEIVSDLGFWPLAVAWTATDVAALWNGGGGYQGYAALPTQYKTTTPPNYYYNLTDGPTTYVDSVAAQNLTGSGTSTTTQRVKSWTDKAQGLVFQPQARVANTNVYQYIRSAEPIYDPNAFTTAKPGVKMQRCQDGTIVTGGVTADIVFSGCSWLYCPVINWCFTQTSNWFFKFQAMDTIGFETFVIATGNDVLDSSSTNNIYLMPGIKYDSGGTHALEMRMRDQTNAAGDPNADIDCFTAALGTLASGSTSMVNGHAYFVDMSWIDATAAIGTSTSVGGARMYVSDNGALYSQQTLYARNGATNVNSFNQEVTQRTYLCLGGGPARYNSQSDGKWGAPTNSNTGGGIMLGPVVCFGPAVNTSQELWLRAWLQTQ